MKCKSHDQGCNLLIKLNLGSSIVKPEMDVTEKIDSVSVFAAVKKTQMTNKEM